LGLDLWPALTECPRVNVRFGPRQIPKAGVISNVNMSDTAQRLARLRAEFNRLKAPDAYELAMSADELKRLLTEIRTEGRALVDQLQAFAKAGKDPGVVTEIAGRLERTLGRLKEQEVE
jgi:hypothetical protein